MENNSEKGRFESEKTENALGWRLFKPNDSKKAKTLSGSERRDIIELKNGKKFYYLKSWPELSVDEAELTKKILATHRENYLSQNNQVPKIIEKYCKENNVELEEDQKEYIKRVIESANSPAGVLSEFLKDNSLEEIAVIGMGKSRPVYVFHESFGWMQTNIYFSDKEEVRRIINAIAGETNRRITMHKPKINAMLNDGSRLNACVEPATILGPSITIRKFRAEPLTPCDLIGFGSVTAEQMAFLWMALCADCSCLVCGNTGSGKTTLLGALFNFIPENERIIAVEETPEINIPQRHTVKMGTSEGIEIGMQDLIINTLRMRPDRVIVGEVRSREEMGAFIDTLLAGQGKGCYGTFHALSAKEAIMRMRNLGVMETDLTSLDIIITQKRWSVYYRGEQHETRKLTEICETKSGGKGISTRRIFSYDYETEKFMKEKIEGKAAEKIRRAFGLKKGELENEVKKRAEFISDLRGKNSEEFFNAIRNYGK